MVTPTPKPVPTGAGALQRPPDIPPEVWEKADDKMKAAMAWGASQVQEKDAKPIQTVWLPGKRNKRKVRDYPERMGRGDRMYEHGALGGWEEYQERPEGTPPLDEVKTWIYDEKRLPGIVKAMANLGYDVSTFENVAKVWDAVTTAASQAYMDGGLKKSPWDMLELMAPSEEEIAARIPHPWRGQSYGETSTDIDFAEMGPETARAIITEALKKALGRGPTEGEIKDFTSRAARIVHENPSKTETTTTYEWDPNATPQGGDYRQTGSTSKQTGTDPDEIAAMVAADAQDSAEENPEAGAYEAATEGFNAFLQAIASPVPNG